MTETDELARALDAAAERWPGMSRARLVTLLALEGHRSAESACEQGRSAKIVALRQHCGAATGCYEAGYLEGTRDGWPE